jgi:hypothetical protein
MKFKPIWIFLPLNFNAGSVKNHMCRQLILPSTAQNSLRELCVSSHWRLGPTWVFAAPPDQKTWLRLRCLGVRFDFKKKVAFISMRPIALQFPPYLGFTFWTGVLGPDIYGAHCR